jgi:ABC-type sulfate/molybdate transport systems ATPase subunit
VLPHADTSAVERVAAGDGAVTLFVRPHEIELIADATSGARISDVASNGPSFRFDIALPGIDKPVEVELTREAVRGRNLKRGDAVRLKILRGRIFEPAQRPAAAAAEKRAASA